MGCTRLRGALMVTSRTFPQELFVLCCTCQVNICPWLSGASLLRLDMTRRHWALALEKYRVPVCITVGSVSRWQHVPWIQVLEDVVDKGPLPGRPKGCYRGTSLVGFSHCGNEHHLEKGFLVKNHGKERGNWDVREASWLWLRVLCVGDCWPFMLHSNVFFV